jgi:hypothetical protein
VPHENSDVAGFPSQSAVGGTTCERDDSRTGILCHSIPPALVGIGIRGYGSGMGGELYLDVLRAIYGFKAVPAKN